MLVLGLMKHIQDARLSCTFLNLTWPPLLTPIRRKIKRRCDCQSVRLNGLRKRCYRLSTSSLKLREHFLTSVTGGLCGRDKTRSMSQLIRFDRLRVTVVPRVLSPESRVVLYIRVSSKDQEREG